MHIVIRVLINTSVDFANRNCFPECQSRAFSASTGLGREGKQVYRIHKEVVASFSVVGVVYLLLPISPENLARINKSIAVTQNTVLLHSTKTLTSFP